MLDMGRFKKVVFITILAPPQKPSRVSLGVVVAQAVKRLNAIVRNVLGDAA